MTQYYEMMISFINGFSCFNRFLDYQCYRCVGPFTVIESQGLVTGFKLSNYSDCIRVVSQQQVGGGLYAVVDVVLIVIVNTWLRINAVGGLLTYTMAVGYITMG